MMSREDCRPNVINRLGGVTSDWQRFLAIGQPSCLAGETSIEIESGAFKPA